VFPVNYALDGETIVFRPDPGTKRDLAARGPVAFEIDSVDRDARRGWSVVVVGRVEEVTHYDAATLDRVTRLAIEPWAAGPKPHWMRLVPTRITGRRVGATAP
jgi:nitroimidazol reductase NimA-like FMN-containing flavoprotein (pyridoxamine 5'-phosphate oxidase superfamily)